MRVARLGVGDVGCHLGSVAISHTGSPETGKVVPSGYWDGSVAI